MTTRIESGGPNTPVTTDPTAYRTTAVPSRPFQSVMSAGASAVVGGAEAAVLQLPGGPILAASFRGAPTTHSANVETPTGTPAGQSSDGSSAPNGTPGGAASMEQVLASSADQNLYFLELQERMAAENRQYSALSNVLKARHETVKNAIGNIR
jgi:hypothetical protein